MTKVDQLNIDKQGGICIAVGAPDTSRAINAVKPLEKDIDVVEIRIDAMQEVSIQELSSAINRPLLITNRPEWEGGFYKGAEEDRLAPLLEAVRHKVAFVDLELKTSIDFREELLAEIHSSLSRLIISYHDFERTPDAEELSAILQEQITSGAHIGKIVTMAHSYLDVLRVLNLQCEAHLQEFPLIAFCMGEEGKLSRVLTLLLGGFMTYAAIDEQQATAPGQLTVQQLKKAIAELSGRTVTG